MYVVLCKKYDVVEINFGTCAINWRKRVSEHFELDLRRGRLLLLQTATFWYLDFLAIVQVGLGVGIRG